MLGAIAGDIIGSVFEHREHKSEQFPLFVPHSRFTDDTVMTVATAEALLEGISYIEAYQRWGRLYPRAGYGGNFIKWIHSNSPKPYNSWGNGAAMRVSPVGWAKNSLEAVESEAARSAMVSHNHPEGIKGAQAVAVAVYLARTGTNKTEICRFLKERYEYDLTRKLEDIRPYYRFDVSCQGSVPQALIAFFESSNFEDAIRKAISLGGDSDTIACIAGAVAEAYYEKVPNHIQQEVRNRLPLPLQEILDRFQETFVFKTS